MVIAGLVLTVLAWIVQLYVTIFRKNTTINPVFLGLYGVGCILLAIGSFTDGSVSSGILNSLDAIIPIVILGTVLSLKRRAS